MHQLFFCFCLSLSSILSHHLSAMDTQNITQRNVKDIDDTHDNPDITTTSGESAKSGSIRRPRDKKRMAMAKRGVKSLAVAVAFPLCLTLLTIYFLGSSDGYGGIIISKPFWFPPMWALHVAFMASSLLMGLSAWLVWAQGGFHRNPMALSLYLAQLGLFLAWDPVVFRFGSSWFGLVVCLAMVGALVGCSRQFKEVNPIAGDLVLLSLAWAAFLALVNLTLVFL